MADLWQLAATSGITVLGTVAGVWAVIKVFGEKLFSFHLQKVLEANKSELRMGEEAHKSELRTEEDAFKQARAYLNDRQLAMLKADIDNLTEAQRLSGQKELARESDARRFQHDFDISKVNDELQSRRDDKLAQRAYLDLVQRAGIDLRSKELSAVSDKRLPAYQKLWVIMKPLSPRSKEPLDQETRTQLSNDFRNWFYDEGDGLLLTWKSLDEYIFATDLLLNPNASDEQVRSAFSGLRTQMKIDLSVYTHDEAGGQIGRLRPRGAESASMTSSEEMGTGPKQSSSSSDQPSGSPDEKTPSFIVGGTPQVAILHPVRSPPSG
jgi:hypothetical protein